MTSCRTGALALLLVCLVHGPGAAQGRKEGPSFRTITTAHGLPSPRVNAIMQTRDRLLWFGTREGFCRYDRGALTLYQPAAGAGDGAPGNDIRCLLEDRSGIMWVGTFGGGFYRFDRTGGALTQYKHEPENANSLSDDRVLSLMEDGNGALWIGTVNGLNVFDRSTLNFSHFRNQPDDPMGLTENRILPLLEDRQGTVWIGTLGGGVNLLERNTGFFRALRQSPPGTPGLSGNSVTALLQDRDGRLWIGLEEEGLTLYSFERDEFDRERPEKYRRYLPGVPVTALEEDSAGRILVGTAGSGVRILDPGTGAVSSLTHDPADPRSLSDNWIRCLLVDADADLWIGTERGGVCVIAPPEQKPRKPRRYR
ncbi:MAG: two-component regulator propeller domain-containing protein [Bacteroidota bacterium]